MENWERTPDTGPQPRAPGAGLAHARERQKQTRPEPGCDSASSEDLPAQEVSGRK